MKREFSVFCVLYVVSLVGAASVGPQGLFAADGVAGEKLGRAVAAGSFNGTTCAAAGAPLADPSVSLQTIG